MKKRILSALLVAVLLASLIITASAAETRAATYQPILSFTGTTATCTFSVSDIGQPITATMELWRGNTRVASWSGSATSRLIISKEKAVTAGQTYTLKVSGTIGGVAFTGMPVTATCPK
jgi:hypothetical protein